MKEEIKIILIVVLLFTAAIGSFMVYLHRPQEGDKCWKETMIFHNQSVDDYLIMNFYRADSEGLPEAFISYNTYIFEGEYVLNPNMVKGEHYKIIWCEVGNKTLIRGIE